ncbi:MAG: RNA methyltransferase [Treponema sp.]|jgi:tRNA/rRNA methyltransferase/tRNA (cytidine32/uridine32-2'-O)-methyltransferase|nr:RNA methyltransferase [Treponema sp.]
MLLDDLVVVLCRPGEPGNLGAVCRAMKNMGLSRLRIVPASLPRAERRKEEAETGERPPRLRLTEETILTRAVHAAEIWENAEHFSSLGAALADCSFAAGATRRRGRRRKQVSMPARELAEFLRGKNGRAAVVFGNERAGLDDRELALCSVATHIPANDDFPSLNLSHAVQIYCYELFRAVGSPRGEAIRPYSADADKKTGGVPGQWVPMTQAEAERSVRNISGALAKTGFYRHPGREEQERFLRDLMLRAGLNLNEGRYLESIIAKAGRLGALSANGM